MFAILKLIRVQNLLIIALLQYIIRWFVIYPVLSEIGFELQFSEFDFFLLVFSTICITAAGYAINDYFDRKADYINRPDSVVVGKHIHQRFAMILHIVLNIIGILLGIYVSYKINLIEIAVIYPIVTGLLWFYSTTYKNHFLTGNIIVALLASLVPLLVVIYEIPMLNQKYGAFIEPGSDFTVLFIITGIVAYFVFLTTLIREIIKDLQDFEGDYAIDRNTMPIIIGVKFTKAVIASLIILVIISIFYVFFKYLNNIYSLCYFVILLIIPLIFLIYKIFAANNKKMYGAASMLTKLIMIAGMLYFIYIQIVEKLLPV